MSMAESVRAKPGPSAEKSLHVDLAVGLMRAFTPLAEHAARLPAGPSNPGCNAGASFSALRDAAAMPPGPAARRFVRERLAQLASPGSHSLLLTLNEGANFDLIDGVLNVPAAAADGTTAPGP